MRSLILAALVAAVAGVVRAAPAASEADREILTTVTAAQAVAFVEARGGTVVSIDAGEEGWAVNFRFASGLNAYAEGYDCASGPGPDAVCSDIELGAVYTADDEAHALRLERDLSFIWVADFADTETDEYTVWRRDCLHRGMTRAQVATLFEIMDDQLIAVTASIWPEDAVAPPNTPVET